MADVPFGEHAFDVMLESTRGQKLGDAGRPGIAVTRPFCETQLDADYCNDFDTGEFGKESWELRYDDVVCRVQ